MVSIGALMIKWPFNHCSSSPLYMQRSDLRDIHQLTKDEFKRILGPVAGSLDDGSKVVLGMQSDLFACRTI